MGEDMTYSNWKRRGGVVFFLGCVLMFVFFWLATNAYIASQYVDRKLYEYSDLNLYLDPVVLQDLKLASDIKEEAKGLEFMVWTHERAQLSRQLIEMLKHRINLSPTNGTLWSQMSYLQRDAGVSLAERAWSIERSARLLKWNFEERGKMSHYCIAEYLEFQRVSPELCSSLITNLPAKWSDAVRAKKANVQLADLRFAMKLEQVKQGRGSEQ